MWLLVCLQPGVIVQQPGSPVIVQQAGGASPIVQHVGSPVVQPRAPPSALVVQQTPTVVQPTPSHPVAPSVPLPPPGVTLLQIETVSSVVQAGSYYLPEVIHVLYSLGYKRARNL